MTKNTAPFFKALTDYVRRAPDTWHCPGHSAGEAYKKTEIGRAFYEFLGERTFRSDVCNAVEELGQLLDHSGAALAAEENAAKVFGCDHLYFVTNGTSTANKIVWNANVCDGDIVVVDRNCHKSVLHAIALTGAVPVYLRPKRNHYGIIGPIAREAFSPESIRRLIEANPLIRDKNRKPRILTLTQSTYDGVIYNTETIKSSLDGFVDVLHFDEAWMPHAAFSPFYRAFHAIDRESPRTKRSPVFATQSTHKFLAGLSQASQVLVRDSESKKLDRVRFNESFMMHTSTSPFYPLIASCDVSAAMMGGDDGKRLVEESLAVAVRFRRAMREEAKKNDWWFTLWEPETLPQREFGAASDWTLQTNDAWHGFGALAENFNRLDPIKMTILTPGLNVDGRFSETGIPGALLAKYLWEHGVIVEKTGLYNVFLMFTIGVTEEKAGRLIEALRAFKRDYDANARVADVMPMFIQTHPRYAALGLADLACRLHEAYKKADLARVTTEMYVSDIVAAMTPRDAYTKFVHDQLECLPVSEVGGRICSTLLTPYPPGIPLIVPGERINREIVDYLKFAEAFSSDFPGFETDVHGLMKEVDAQGRVRFFLDVVVD